MAGARRCPDWTLRLHDVLERQLVAAPSLLRVYRSLELPLLAVLSEMEGHGVLLDAAPLLTPWLPLQEASFRLSPKQQ